MPINAADYALVRTLREKRILEDVTPELFRAAEGAITVFCGDCDQSHDLGPQQRNFCANHHSHPRVHDIALNGGGLLLAEDSPLHAGLPQDLVLVHSIVGAHRLKGISTVALYTHCPCGAANLVGFSFQRILEELFKGKARLRALLETRQLNLKLVCFVHIDYGEFLDGKRRTYYVGRQKWEAYQVELGIRASDVAAAAE